MYYVGSMACDPNYLEHHGIPNMRWGVRRFQNPDGTLTEAGKLRYSKGLTDKERSRYDKYDRSARGIEKSFDRMDKDFAVHYGKYKEHEHRANKFVKKSLKRMRNKFGSDPEVRDKAVEWAKTDKRINMWADKSADSLMRAKSEITKMNEIEGLQWKKVVEGLELGYDIKATNVTRNTDKLRAGMTVVGSIIGGTAGYIGGKMLGGKYGKSIGLNDRGKASLAALTSTFGVGAGGSAYDLYKSAKGNPMSMTGNMITVTKSNSEDGQGRFTPTPMMAMQMQRAQAAKDEEERKKNSSK